MARLRRWWRHRTTSERALYRRFDSAAFDRIESAIAEGEVSHLGEIRFALEPDLGFASLMAAKSPRDRALEVFAREAIWDTEDNAGVLIYLLSADHAVEIIADRAADRALPREAWQKICATMVDACRAGRPVDGVIAAIRAINVALDHTLPASGARNPDELSNRPIRL